MRRFTRLLPGLWITLLCAFAMAEARAASDAAGDSQNPGQRIGRLVVFSDSLSDDGGNNSTWFLLKTLNGQTGEQGINHMAPFVHDWLKERISNYNWMCSYVLSNCSVYEAKALSALIALMKKSKAIPVSPKSHYDNGRWSNGMVWPEYLAHSLGLVSDSAVPGDLPESQRPGYINNSHAGSWSLCLGDKALGVKDIIVKSNLAGLAKSMIKGSLIPPCLELIFKGFLYDHGGFESDDFVVMFYGGNDYLNRFQNPPQVVAAQVEIIERMVETGARHIAWLNMPDLSLTPRFSSGVYRNQAAEVSRLISKHNTLLHNEWQRLSQKYSAIGINIIFIDARSIFSEMINQRSSYDLTIVDQPCSTFPIPGLDTLVKNDPVKAKAKVPQGVCDNPGDYVFWDTVHPTTAVHEIIADKACELLRSDGYICEDSRP